ncbi:MAG: YceI family protein [Chitinophagaceae bacterium]|uniref:YceI family protein n=1 Tax=unclassified Paraflavitalea TaxID=2798305 RepID=UPI003D358B63|nr:YceI family protein [Chitinophagaceae bacterium]
MQTTMKNLLVALLFITSSAQAQDKFFTKTGKIYFDCTGGIEKIEATNKSTTCVLDSKAGLIQFSVLLKGFEFEKALMEEHFNENYVESDKFPKATFAGTITNNSEINYAKDGVYTAKVKGKLTMHGETKDVEAIGKVTVKKGVVVAAADFNILLSDFKVAIPSVVKDKINNKVTITVDCQLDPLKS